MTTDQDISLRGIEWIALPLVVLGLDERIEHANPAARDFLGIAEEPMSGARFSALFENQEGVSQWLADRYTGAEATHPLITPLCATGRTQQRTVVVRAVPTYRPDLSGVLLSLSPLGSAKRTALEYQAIMANAPVAIGFSQHRRITRYNAKFREMFGFSGDEAIGLPTIDTYPSEQAYAEVSERAFPLLSTGQPFVSEIQFRRKDGGLFWGEAIAYLVDPDNPPEGSIWIVTDITARRAAEEARRQTLLELETILHNASVGILYSRERIIQRCNARAAEIFGYGQDELTGRPASSIYPSAQEYRAVGAQAGPLLAAGSSYRKDLLFRRKDGSLVWCRIYAKAFDPEDTRRGTIWIVEDRTAQRQAEEALKSAYAEQQLIFDHSVVGIAFIRNRVIHRCNRRMAELYGYTVEEMIGRNTRELYRSEAGWKKAGETSYPALEQGITFSDEIPQCRRNGEAFWARVTGKAIDPADPEAGSIWNYEDVTERKLAEEALRDSELLQRAILDSAAHLILTADPAGTLTSCNPASLTMLGYRPDELVGKVRVDSLFDAEELAERRQDHFTNTAIDPAPGTKHPLLATALIGRRSEDEWTMARRDGSRFPAQVSVCALHHSAEQGSGFLLIATDITERKRAELDLLRTRNELEIRVEARTAQLEAEVVERRKAERRLRHRALHDPLTGLPNRSLLETRIEEAIAEAELDQSLIAVMFIGLDRFKTINDSLGHHVGDSLLRKVGGRLRCALRADDTVARIGGDEFVVLAAGLASRDEALALAASFQAEFDAPVSLDTHEIYVTPSIGIAVFPHDGTTVSTLMRNADTALHSAKADGRNMIRAFDATMKVAAEQYFEIEIRLRHAIEYEQLLLHYQPVVDCQSGKLSGLEALIRWKHPELGLIGPNLFIPAAEESGLVNAIGAWVLRTACRQIRIWRDAGYPVVPVAINLSAVQFRNSELARDIEAALQAEGLVPSDLELEITETVIMADVERTLSVLQQLDRLGVSLSVDDFGTGYSSLAYLKRFPVRKLKIDRAFVSDAPDNADDRAIVETILSLANSMELITVAEGVETEAQHALLRQLGCPLLQGFLFCRPVPAETIEQLWWGARSPDQASAG